jgi:hypothetical protein
VVLTFISIPNEEITSKVTEDKISAIEEEKVFTWRAEF